MWKVINFLKRRAGTSREEFQQYWTEVQFPLMSQQADFWRHVQTYIQNDPLTVTQSDRETRHSYDGASEFWFADRAEVEAAFKEDGFQDVIVPSAANFLDLTGSLSILAEVNSVKDTGPTGIKVIGVGHAREGLSRDEAQEYWRNNHPQFAARETPEFWSMIKRYVQNHIRTPDGIALSTLTDEFDLCGEMGCDSVEAMEAAYARPEYLETIQDDEKKFSSKSEGIWLITRERVLYSTP